MGMLPSLLILSSLVSFLMLFKLITAADSITLNQSVSTDAGTLTSLGERFKLGFFSPPNSKNRYLGIWYKSTPSKVVWVANRNNPLSGLYGNLTISNNGNFVLLNRNGSSIWSSNISRIPKSPVVQLLDSGNLVLRDNVSTSSGSYLWQSFDYPSDTLLPDMKISWNINTGSERYLTSWKSTDDPSTGNFSYKIDMKGLPQLVVVMGSIIKFRTEPWNGVRLSGLPRPANSAFHQIMGFKEDEWYYKFEPNKNVAAS